MSKIQGIHTHEHNFIINGNFDYWERQGTGSTTLSNGQGIIYPDRFITSLSGPNAKSIYVGRNGLVPTLAQSGYQSLNSFQVTSLTNATFAADDVVEACLYGIEGTDYEKIHGQKVTLSFWFYASQTGTYPVAFYSQSASLSYVATFNVNNANTWEFKTITVQLSSTSGWAFDNSPGMYIRFAECAGSTYQAPSINQWVSGNYVTHSSCLNWVAAGGTFLISQVKLQLGGTFTSFSTCGSTAAEEKLRCQRYFSGPVIATSVIALNTTFADFRIEYPTPMRTAPSLYATSLVSGVSIYNYAFNATSANTGFNILVNNVNGAMLRIGTYSGLPTGTALFPNTGADNSSFFADAEY